MTAPLCPSLHSQVTIVGYRKSSIEPLGDGGGGLIYFKHIWGGYSFIVVSDFTQSIIY